jgi:tetratricopeptide (TPR) repeat protein
MKRWMWLALTALIVIGVGATLVALPDKREWTTDSPEALAAFEAGMAAQKKLYWEDAAEHFARASELDPDFVVAKLMCVDQKMEKDKESGEALLDEVLAADTSALTLRERYFIERARAAHEDRDEDIPKIIDTYQAKLPDDPYVLNDKAQWAFSHGDFAEADQLYQRLVDIAPNWALGYNQLGYISLSEGRFAEAEERFKSYRFLRPDQANPHDSLGELYIALGRNAEAEESFEKAIESKPNFWPAYEHLTLLKSYNDDLEGARAAVDRAQAAGMPENYVNGLDCHVQFMGLRKTASWREILDLAESSECIRKDRVNFPMTMTHLAACELGDWDTALEIEASAGELLESFEEKGYSGRNIEMLRAAVDHLRGVRLALQGDYGQAERMLRSADQGLSYIEAGSAIFKLYNRMILTELLLADGQEAEAHALLSKVRGVNPLWVEEFQDSGFKMLGLERG